MLYTESEKKHEERKKIYIHTMHWVTYYMNALCILNQPSLQQLFLLYMNIQINVNNIAGIMVLLCLKCFLMQKSEEEEEQKKNSCHT